MAQNCLTSILHGTANRTGGVTEDVVTFAVENDNLVAPSGIALATFMIENHGKIRLREIVCNGDGGAALVEGLDDLSSLRTSATCLVSTTAPASAAVCIRVAPCTPPATHLP